ncbi:MAG TPA: hypothetical protein VKA70_03140 [Blastocatellia bacterium]|nr:hypothetical protein [Blastocatellia bacterium]
MKDDYLWDGTGEPDPEVERLEQMLSVYKHQPKKLDLPARPTVWFPRHLAAAAAIALMAIAGLLVYLNKGSQTPPVVADRNNPAIEQPAPGPQTGPQSNPGEVDNQEGSKPRATDGQIAERRPVRRAPKRVEKPEPENADQNVAGLAYFDLETAKHLEKAEMLLRSFKNVSLDSDDYVAEASYEKELSRKILQRNVQLRLNAEAKGNLPAEELLGSLEPLLLDIANLPERPSQEDVRSVKERILKTEMIPTLQIYSAPIMARND